MQKFLNVYLKKIRKVINEFNLMDRKTKELVKEYEDKGWYLHRTGKHLIYKHKDGGTVTISGTTSDRNDHWNIKRYFRKEERLRLEKVKRLEAVS